MGRKGRRWWPFGAIAAIAAGALLLLVTVWQSPHRSSLISYWGLAATVVTIAAGWISWLWRARAQAATGAADAAAVDHAADVLAQAVTGQWARAAADRGLLAPEPIPVRWRRPSVPLASPGAAAAAARRFAPLPGLDLVTASQLTRGSIADLHKVYGGLGSGRLVIAGAPGSGKSGSAILLLLAALAHREQVTDADRPRVPVPVMFTLHGWDPVTQPVQEWLAGRLGQTYPLLAGQAGAARAVSLLTAGKIAVILDGLDEIPASLRSTALQALSRQATFRLVLLTRTQEMAAAAAHHHLDGAAAVELQDVDAATAARYLTRVQLDPPPPGWRDLVGQLRRQPGSPLAQALASPLTLGLLRDTYHGLDDARELLHLCSNPDNGTATDDITGYLLDRVLTAAYAHQPGQPPPPYSLTTAQRTLSQLATQMNREGTRDLRWWTIRRWASVIPRILTSLAVLVLAAWLIEILVRYSEPGSGQYGISTLNHLATGLEDGLRLGMMFGLVFLIVTARRHRMMPRRIMLRSWRLTGRHLASKLWPGLIIGAFLGLFARFETHTWLGGAVVLPVAWLATSLLLLSATSSGNDDGSFAPAGSWRQDLAFGLAMGLLAGLAAVATEGSIWAIYGAVAAAAAGLGNGLATGLVFVAFSTRTWGTSLAFAQLAVRWRTPLRLMRFLEDAHQRNVLRTIGPVYQFRHARLQDRLAEQTARSATQPSNAPTPVPDTP